MKFNKIGYEEVEIENTIMQERKTGGMLKTLMNRKNIKVECTLRSLHDGVLVPALMYGSETLVNIGQDSSK